MNPTFQCLFQGINDLARRAGITEFRVQFKRNAEGESVFALIVADIEASSRDPDGSQRAGPPGRLQLGDG